MARSPERSDEGSSSSDSSADDDSESDSSDESGSDSSEEDDSKSCDSAPECPLPVVSSQDSSSQDAVGAPGKKRSCNEGTNGPSTGAAPATAVGTTSEVAVHSPVFPASTASLDQPSPAVHDPPPSSPTSSGETGAGGTGRGRTRSSSQASGVDDNDVVVTRSRSRSNSGDIADDIIDGGIGAPHDFSVTIGARGGGNIRESVFKDGCDWMRKRAVRGVTSMERGDINGNLHLQAVWTLGLKKDYGDTKKEEAALRRKLRADCGWTSADKVKITIKRLIKQQTFSGMVGYVSKDEGRSHFKTVTKGVSRTEVNIALAEYRTLKRSVVSELRTDVGKKNFWGILRRFKQEHLRGISVSPLQLAVWLINDCGCMPSHTWICPTSAYPMEAARCDAYFTALMSPSLFTRKDGYLLFFSGGQGGRVSSSYEKWDYQDREFSDMTVDQAKVCSHDRLELEGAMDIARERIMRDIAESHAAPAGVLNFPVDADSDDDSVQPDDNAVPRPRAVRQWDRIGRTAADTSPESEDLPLIVSPKCVEPGCVRDGNIAMVSCSLCDGDLHRSCGVRGGEEDADSDVLA
eukprot:g8618.t1